MKLSIIIPVYNVKDYLSRTLVNVLSQVFKDFELILVDDGSTDGSGEICDRFAVIDSRVRVIHQPNAGVSAARNTGVASARGDFIGFVDSDDIIEPNMYEQLFRAQENYHADIVECRHNGRRNLCYPSPYNDENAVVVTPVGFIEHMFNRSGDEYTNEVSLWSKIYKRECFNGIVFPYSRTYEDEQATYRICMNAQRIVLLQEEYYHYVKREGSIITAVSPRKIKDKQLALRDRLVDMSERLKQFEQKAAIAFWGFSCLALKDLQVLYPNDEKEIVNVLLEQKRLIMRFLDKYQKLYLEMFRIPFLRKWIVKNDFEPIQNFIRKVKRKK